jgi:hypothetical protein
MTPTAPASPGIVERLRHVARCTDADPAIEVASAALLNEAADLIARLTTYGDARAAEMRAALKPFAKEADRYEPNEGDDNDHLWAANQSHSGLRIKHLRAARDAIRDHAREKAARLAAEEKARAWETASGKGEA